VLASEESTLTTLIQKIGKAIGLTRRRLKARKLRKGKPIIGYTDTSTVKIDFDKVTFKKVKATALRVCEWFNLKGFIVFKSSGRCFHVVFDKAVSWRQNVAILGWTCYITRFSLPLMKYTIMQLIKKSSTLRISSKRRKRPPRIVYRFGSQSYMIRNFLETRKEVRRF
jgi:hypothetical protein